MYLRCKTVFILFVGVLVSLSALQVSQAASCFTPPSGLVGWWPGDGNANDIIGSGNGTLQGGATATAVGEVASAFSFDGNAGYVSIPDSAAYHPANFTIEAWVKFNSLNSNGSGNSPAGDQYIVFKQNSLSSDFEGIDLSKMRTNTGDVFRLLVSSSSGQSVQINSTSLVTTGVWYHVAAVRGSNFIQLYVNGQLQAQATVTFAQNYGTRPLYFGSSGQSYWDHKLNGLLDEVSLYNRALSASEISSIYAAGTSGKCKSTDTLAITTQPQSQSVTAGANVSFNVAASGTAPIGYQWKFNGANISGATATALNLTSVQSANAGNYTVVANNSTLSVTSTVAVLTVTATATAPAITTQPASQSVPAGSSVSFSVTASGTAPLAYQWKLNNANLSGATGSNLTLANVQSTDAGNYTVVVNNSAGSVTSSPAVLTVTATSGGGSANCLTPPSGLVGWWPGDGNAYDIVSYDNGTLQGGATATATGEVGSAFNFDGTNSYVSIPDSTALHPANFTIETWVKFNSLNSTASGSSPAGDQYIVFKQNSLTSNFEGFDFGKTRTSTGDVFRLLVTSSSGQSVSINSTTLVNTGIWYHVAAVRGSNYTQLYVNGQLQAQATVTFAQNYGTLPLYFGSSGQSYWDHKFAGSLDEVSFYNRALAASEISSIYSAGASGKCKTTSGLAIVSQPQSQTVSAGANVSFTVGVSGTAPISCQWKFNGTSLSGATTSALNLTSVQTANAGNYTVVVANSSATVTSAVAVLTVQTQAPAGYVTVNGAQTYQTIDGFGVNANHRSWNNADLKPVLDALIDQGGMTLFHVIFDNNNWETSNDNSDPNTMNWTYYNSIYSSAEFQKMWGIMAYLNQRGIVNGLVPDFEGPVANWMGGLTLASGEEAEYAETIASLLVYARNTQHLQFNTVGPVNEPDLTYSGIHMSGPSQYVTVMRDLSKLLDNNGMSDVRFSGPDLGNTSTSWLAAVMSDSVLMSKLAHFGLHSYQNETADASGVYNFIKQSAYPNTHFWMTEYNVWCANCQNSVGGDNSWSYARGTASFLLNLLSEGASAGIVWEGYDSQYTDFNPSTGGNNPVHWSYWGLFSVDNINAASKTYTARKSFYTTAQISKFVRPGSQRIAVGTPPSGITLLAFYNATNGQVTLTGINASSSATTLSCALTSLPAIPNLNLYYTSSSANLASGGQVIVTGNSFSTTIPADCVFTLTYSNSVTQQSVKQSNIVPSTAPTFLAPMIQGGNVSLTLNGIANCSCRVEASTDLTNWQEIQTVTLKDGVATINDVAATGRRFYRAILLP